MLFRSSVFPVASNSFANMDIMVYMKNGNTLSLGIKSEDVPEFVIKALEKEFR